MTTRYLGAPIARNEDPRLLTGRAQFVNDVERPRMLQVAFLRSPYAHARLGAVDLLRVRERPGVVAAYAADDLGDYWKPGPLLVPPPPIEGTIFNQRTQVPLARGKVRHVGEPVAVVVAESRYIAEDALADIAVEYQPLPAVTDLERALAPDSARVHDDVTGNVAARVHQRKGDYDAARRAAFLVLRRRFRYDRGCSAPIETRGVVADWDAKAERLTVWDTTQAPVVVRNGLASMLGLSERQVRVVAPFIGGGFGPKIMMFYPEEVLLPWLAIRLNRPVKWIEERAKPISERQFFSFGEIAKRLARDPRDLAIDPVIRERVDRDLVEWAQTRLFGAGEVLLLGGDPPDFRPLELPSLPAGGITLFPDNEALALRRGACRRYGEARSELPGAAGLLRDWFATQPEAAGADNREFREAILSVIHEHGRPGKTVLWKRSAISSVRGTAFPPRRAATATKRSSARCGQSRRKRTNRTLRTCPTCPADTSIFPDDPPVKRGVAQRSHNAGGSMHSIIEDLRAALPPVWLGTRTDELTGGAISWGTTQNRRSRGEIPDGCFARSGTRVLVIRDPFLSWWATTLSEARRPPVVSPPRRQRRNRADELGRAVSSG
jgi:hypothetical protein